MKTELDIASYLTEFINECESRIERARAALSVITGIEVSDDLRRDVPDMEKVKTVVGDHDERLHKIEQLVYTHKNEVSAQLNAQELRMAGAFNEWDEWAVRFDKEINRRIDEVNLKLTDQHLVNQTFESINRQFDVSISNIRQRIIGIKAKSDANAELAASHEIRISELGMEVVFVKTQLESFTPPPKAKKQDERPCLMCGAPFIPKMKTSQYCGLKCSKKASNANQRKKHDVKKKSSL